ncbi:MAG: NAD(P)-dependent oxidoreductase [Verrucomicrobiales bacterium]|nr:NAD(P)-dependent oxidoreductase [Verrucomicrobiales bacterium]
MKAWVTGAAGMIGSEIASSASKWAPDWEVRGLTRRDFSLLDFDAVTAAFKGDSPDVIVHCAAISRPVDCERDPHLARKTNVVATRHLAHLASDRFLIYLSTDLVYDGRKGDYIEEDPANPLHLYGETKLAGEDAVRQHQNHAVLRTALNFGASPRGNASFNEQMHSALAQGKNFQLFTDEYRCPISTTETARAIWELAKLQVGGLFLLGGSEKVSRWDIGKALYDRWSPLPGKIEPASIASYDGPPRPPDLSMKLNKIQALLSFDLPGFHEWINSNPDAVV